VLFRSTFRLPTEAEWEYACRAGTTTRFCSGDAESDLKGVAWYGAYIGGKTHRVGQKKPNAWGLYDMHGNVWEWCADWLGCYSEEAITDPQGPSRGADRLLRGGSWFYDPWACCSAFRFGYNSVGRFDFGFRVVVGVPKTP